MKKIRLGDKWIGEGEACFIIAEAGVNHNGDLKLAKKLIGVAKEAGADAVKFQSFKAEDVVTRNAEKAGYQKESTSTEESQYEMIKKLGLSEADFKDLSDYAIEKGIIFLSSPFDKESADLLETLGVPAYKIPSGEITNLPLLKHIASKQKPIILSTGMSTIDEIDEALKIIREEGVKEIVLLHCVSSYPAKPTDMNLKVMETLRSAFGLPVGLSDHTLGITIPIAAVVMGACVIEKHITLDKSLPGPDHRMSLEPGELQDMIKAIRDAEVAIGDGTKKLSEDEEENKKVVRRSIVARVNIPAGVIITKDMLDIKRPGTGIEARYLDMVTGKKAKTRISKDELITWQKIST